MSRSENIIYCYHQLQGGCDPTTRLTSSEMLVPSNIVVFCRTPGVLLSAALSHRLHVGSAEESWEGENRTKMHFFVNALRVCMNSHISVCSEKHPVIYIANKASCM